MKWYWKYFSSYKDRGMTQEEFYAGSQVENAGASWDEIMGVFHQLDHNGDGNLSKKEFFSMSEMDGHDGKNEKDMNADDFWQKYSNDGHMKWVDFKRAYEHAEPGATWEQIDQMWNLGDHDGNQRMSKDEFMRLVSEYDNEQEKGDKISPDEYWKKFSGPEGMDYKSFEAGYRYAEPKVD
jgi:Ca2+-binding EF-hand superfamily protein